MVKCIITIIGILVGAILGSFLGVKLAYWMIYRK
jgi:uncharacterized protein YneF (UPF0154 family)